LKDKPERGLSYWALRDMGHSRMEHKGKYKINNFASRKGRRRFTMQNGKNPHVRIEGWQVKGKKKIFNQSWGYLVGGRTSLTL